MTGIRRPKRTSPGPNACLGLTFTPAERAQMLGGFDGQTGGARQIRDWRLPNGAPMASRFDPRLPGFRMPAGPSVRAVLRRRSGAAARQRRGHRLRPRHAPRRVDPARRAHQPAADARSTSTASPTLNGPKLVLLRHGHARDRAGRGRRRRRADAGGREPRAAARAFPMASRTSSTPRASSPAGARSPTATACPRRTPPSSTLLRRAGAVLLGKTTVGASPTTTSGTAARRSNPWNLNEGSRGSRAGSASRHGGGALRLLPSARRRWGRSPRPASAAAPRACAPPSGG